MSKGHSSRMSFGWLRPLRPQPTKGHSGLSYKSTQGHLPNFNPNNNDRPIVYFILQNGKISNLWPVACVSPNYNFVHETLRPSFFGPKSSIRFVYLEKYKKGSPYGKPCHMTMFVTCDISKLNPTSGTTCYQAISYLFEFLGQSFTQSRWYLTQYKYVRNLDYLDYGYLKFN